MTDDELSAKFQDCTHLAFQQKEIDTVLQMLQNLESLADISKLMNVITYR